MEYSNLPITTSSPGCLVFLLDQSNSMGDPFGGDDSNSRKADGLADAINRLLQTLVIRCTRTAGVRGYFDVAVLGYNSVHIGSVLGGELAGQDLVPVTKVAATPLRVETRKRRRPGDVPGTFVEQEERFPVWVEPTCGPWTPMCAALEKAHAIVASWITRYPAAFPPLVIHITDGESTDGNPVPAAQRVRSLRTEDGNALLFNCHLSTLSSPPVLFPDRREVLPDRFAEQLFDMSSVLPPLFREEARREGFVVSDASRGFAFNADLVQLIQFLDIGSRASNQIR